MIIGTILAFAVVVIITQLETNAATASTSLSFEQTQTNKCSGFVPCGNTGTIVFPLYYIIAIIPQFYFCQNIIYCDTKGL